MFLFYKNLGSISVMAQRKNTHGFITMIVMMVLALVVIIGLAYMRVQSAQK